MGETIGKFDVKLMINQSVHRYDWYHIFRQTYLLALNFPEGCTPRLSKTPLMLVPSYQSNSMQRQRGNLPCHKNRLKKRGKPDKNMVHTPNDHSPSGMVYEVHTIHSE